MKKKKLMALGLATVMAMSFAACGGQAATGQNATDNQSVSAEVSSDAAGTDAVADIVDDGSYEECTLTFSWWGGDSRHEATLKAIEAFEAKYPGIDVEATYGTWSGWEDSMATMFATQTAPDVNQVNWNWLTSYSEDGSAFMDLNEVSAVLDLSQYDEDALEQCVVADELQAVPVSMTGRIFYWNEATFEKAGIAVPTSLEELMAAGETFKTQLGDDYYPLVLGEYDRMILMVYYLESVYGKPWVENNELQYTSEEIQEGLAFIQSLEDAHVTPSIQTILGDGADSLDKNPKWMNGTYAGIFEWDSSASKFNGALEEGQEFVVGDYFADMGEYQGGYSKVSLGFAISETCENPKEAAMLLDFLLNEAEGTTIMASERGIPLSSAALENCTEQGLLNETVAEANGKVLDWVSFPLDPKFEAAALKSSDGVYYDAMAGLSYDEYSLEEAAEILIDGINEELSK
ncbi:MAG: carbohydrate ABC transporter substrate-binding protein [Lachnospiraceae bacterium]|nr:carbohydrate ABC transporter substrate-binding protein [Lachnospiraceae bacterium]